MSTDNSDIIFIGSHYPQSLKQELITEGMFVDYPADVLQRAILAGLDKNGEMPLALSKVRTINWPKNRKKTYEPVAFSRRDDDVLSDYYVGSVNFAFLKLLITVHRLSKKLKEYTNNGEKRKVIVYALGTPSLLAVWLNRKRLVTTSVIIPDLPEFMSAKKSIFFNAAKAIDRFFIHKLLHSCVDRVILLSPHMREKLPITDKPWLQLEGIFYQNSEESEIEEKFKEKVLFYSGSLARRYGALDLLNAFELIKSPEYRLMFCGSGDTVEEIKRVSSIDSRVEYLGVLPRETVLKLQKKATLLINPRHKSEKGFQEHRQLLFFFLRY